MSFTRYGEALYLHSSSELQRISVSATSVTQVNCFLNLPTRDQLPKSRSITPINGYTDDEQEDFPKVNGIYILFKIKTLYYNNIFNTFYILYCRLTEWFTRKW